MIKITKREKYFKNDINACNHSDCTYMRMHLMHLLIYAKSYLLFTDFMSSCATLQLLRFPSLSSLFKKKNFARTFLRAKRSCERFHRNSNEDFIVQMYIVHFENVKQTFLC